MAIEYPNIDFKKICEENDVSLDYPIGKKQAMARSAMNGKSTVKLESEEKEILLKLRVIKPTKEKTKELQQAKQQCDEAKAKNDQAKELERQVAGELKKRGKNYEEQ